MIGAGPGGRRAAQDRGPLGNGGPWGYSMSPAGGGPAPPGHSIVIIEPGTSRAVLEVDAYTLHETFSANGKTLVVNVDAGPDLFRLNADGQLVVAITGRPVPGSGVTGR